MESNEADNENIIGLIELQRDQNEANIKAISTAVDDEGDDLYEKDVMLHGDTTKKSREANDEERSNDSDGMYDNDSNKPTSLQGNQKTTFNANDEEGDELYENNILPVDNTTMKLNDPKTHPTVYI